MHVLYTFPHVLGRPGIATTARQQVLSLVSQGCDVDLWCAANEADLPSCVQVFETLRLAGQRIPHRLLGVERAYRWHDWRVAQSLSCRNDVQVIHAWPGSLRTLNMARRLGLPALREIPNMHTAQAVEQVALENEILHFTAPRNHTHAVTTANLAAEDAEYRAATRLLIPSDSVAKTFLAQGFGADRWVRHRYGYDPERFMPRSGEPAKSAPLTAVFAGSCEPRKGLHYAVQAWHQSGACQSGRLLVCGDFLPGYADAIGAPLRHPSIELLGFSDQLPALLKAADVLLLPSVEEGSALVVYEAMGAGCVPLVSEAVGAPCQHGVDALIHQPRDVAVLTQHLRILVENRNYLQQLRCGVLTVAPELTWAAAGKILVNAYQIAMDDLGRCVKEYERW